MPLKNESQIEMKKDNDVFIAGEKLSKIDIGADVDLMIAVANLIKLEEHYANSYEFTRDDIFLKLWHETRMDRGKLMSTLLKTLGVDLDKIERKGDTWCTNKHHLSTWYGLRESASKYIAEGKFDIAKLLLEVSTKEMARFWIDIEYMKGNIKPEKP
ncbi:MAG: hypothetical protein J7K47_02385 [Thermoplasmata archaeon]|nr:hypothetical protein [Thermoplasmata archaeon]